MWLDKQGTLLAVGAHFDDIEIGCGGSIALASKRGWSTHMLVITHSAYTSVNWVERTKEQAKHEGQEAAEVLGANIHRLGRNTLNLSWDKSLVEDINIIISGIKPDVVLSHLGDTHQDHHHAAMATISASRRVPTVLLYEPFHPASRGNSFNPQLYVDISDTIDVKKEALLKHKTQVERYGNKWIPAIEARAKLRGFECECDHAEAFQVLRMTIR